MVGARSKKNSRPRMVPSCCARVELIRALLRYGSGASPTSAAQAASYGQYCAVIVIFVSTLFPSKASKGMLVLRRTAHIFTTNSKGI